MQQLNPLEQSARRMRQDILRMVHKAGSGHPGGSLSSVEIMTALYFGDVLRIDPTKPDDPDHDWFILSKGHCAPVLYSALCRRGYFDPSHLDTLRQLGSILQGHPHAHLTPGLDCSSGSLGQGLSISCGLAIGLRAQKSTRRVYCLMGDGELQEGQIWEAALTGAQHQLSNLCAIVDNNHVQLDDRTERIKRMEPLADKWRAFGWNVIEADGHSIPAMLEAYTAAAEEKTLPSVIIAETIKGKGVSFMEDDCGWHGLAPDAAQLETALAELERGVGEV